MKRLALGLYLVVGLLAVTARGGVDPEAQVEALRQIETPHGWDGRPGPAGELGEWQITAAVWRQHMPGMPFAKARQHRHARACALKHVRWLVAQLDRHGYEPTPARVATAWNIGLTAFLRRHGRVTDFGQRTANLYASLP
jgi:hypothetical protein